jgi:ASC-1-like (ASCH) protein
MTQSVDFVNPNELMAAVSGNEFWEMYLQSVLLSKAARLHLAVLVEPYLSYIMEGSKTVESRFARTRGAPYRRVNAGDIVLLKRQSGGVEGLCCVADAWFYELESSSWKEILEKFGSAMRVSSQFLDSRNNAMYATLIRITEVLPLPSLRTQKRDRRGWVVLRDTLSEAVTENSETGQYTLSV